MKGQEPQRGRIQAIASPVASATSPTQQMLNLFGGTVLKATFS